MSTRQTLAPVPAPASLGGRLGDLLFSTDFRQRRCLSALLLAAMVYGVCLGILAYGSAQGIFPAGPVRVLAALMATVTLGFYIAVRSGFNQRLAQPTLALPQAVVAQTLIAAGYAVSGTVHSGNLVLLALVMAFSMFDVNVRNARILAGYSIGLIGAVMLWCARADPVVYQPNHEIMYFVVTATVLAAMSQLSVLLSTMRRRLKSQKTELEQALAHIQELATHDELTGLANRRHVLDLLDQHALRQARGGPTFYVAMADLDHFKRINDTHGHAVGDDALRTFARQAQAILRNTDVVGRWGGEEFLLLMPETPPGDPNVGLERLRENLAQCEASAQVAGLHVRFSAGLSRYRDGEAIGDTIERADRALYAAKAAGRDRTVAL